MTLTPHRRAALGLAFMASWSIMMASAFLGYFTGDNWWLASFAPSFISTLVLYFFVTAYW